jgi:ribbon-helix-helix CopG family protein
LANEEYGSILEIMAIPKIKATYSLDAETTALLDKLAQRWAVSKSEALRRIIRAAGSAAESNKAQASPRLAAFDRAQQSLGLTERVAAVWERQVRAERKASSRRVR